MLSVTAIQKFLKDKGFYKYTIDGDWGPLTQRAATAYHRQFGVSPAWLNVAEVELGVHEILGPRSNKRVLEYHQHTSLKASDDAVPWCSSFVNFCMNHVELPGTNSAAARSWLKWGNPIQEFQYGCVCVFTRGRVDASTGHVGFGVWEDSNSLAVLGGNQGDAVCVKIMRKGGLLGYRWWA